MVMPLVRIVEKELGWGYRTIRTVNFDDVAEAQRYCDQWNEDELARNDYCGSIFYAQVEEVE